MLLQSNSRFLRASAPLAIAFLLLGTTACLASDKPSEPTMSSETSVLGDSSSLLERPLRLERVFTEITLPNIVFLTHASDETDRLFAVLQDGEIAVFPNIPDAQSQTTFLDIRNKVEFDGEEGLLGLAFDPDYRDNGRFYVYYSTSSPRRTILSRFLVSSTDPNRADVGSEKSLLEIEQPYRNHNGGMIAFGPDGYLYVGLGDGGSAGDPRGNAQNRRALLGSVLRIDVRSDGTYEIPSDNPFVGGSEGLPEIWAYGLRNPWRFSFDRASGDLWLADVGQSSWEEVNLITSGENYGWNRMEGSHCYPTGGTGCNQGGLIPPVTEYSHNEGCSVTGGYVYRGPLSHLQGLYIFGDFCSGTIWGLRYTQSDGATEQAQLMDTSLTISSFGEDKAGELYVLDYEGGIYRFVEP